MYKIAVCSMFRDSLIWEGREINQVNRYFKQMQEQSIGAENLYLYALEGDSTDLTYDALRHYRHRLEYGFGGFNLVKKDINQAYDSTSASSRIEALSRIANYLLGTIDNMECDYILWIESDFTIKQDLISRMIETSRKIDKPSIIAPYPVINLNGQNRFYDCWGFRDLKNRKWDNHHRADGGIHEMTTIGSCALIDGETFRNYRINFGIEAFIGLCKQFRNAGGGVYTDTSIVIEHPNRRIGNRWV